MLRQHSVIFFAIFSPLMAEYQQTKVDMQNLQVITFQIRYRSSKSVKAKLQKWTFYGVDLDPQTTFSDFFAIFSPLRQNINKPSWYLEFTSHYLSNKVLTIQIHEGKASEMDCLCKWVILCIV